MIQLSRWAWVLPAALATVQILATAWATSRGRLNSISWLLAGVGFASLFLALGVFAIHEHSLVLARRSASQTLRKTAEWVDEMTDQVLDDDPQTQDAEGADALAAAVGRLLGKVAPARLAAQLDKRSLQDSRVISFKKPPPANGIVPVLTRSGLYDSPFRFDASNDPMASQEFPAARSDMIGRLDPREFRWIDSSPAEQAFLGWPLATLRKMSFLDVVHADHRDLAREQLRAAIAKGEAHGLVYRIKTARGEAKAIEVNVSVRYAADAAVDHLRCHVSDVTDRLRASRELRRRTRELLAANGQLVTTNCELKELKDRYSDLYQNAPAMYFSVDQSGIFLDCNQTLLQTLGFAREDLIGQPYVTILPESRKPLFATNFARFLQTGNVETESRWIKKSGELIDVWVKATGVIDAEGNVSRSRSLAQDITARKALEAELRERNARVARSNEELERKNKELDEFSHVVSHDLQEPLRSIIAFSEILSREYSDRLDETGREYVGYLVDGSRRMRLLIRDLLNLSRAGRAAGDFREVGMEAILSQIQVDYAAMFLEGGAQFIIERPLANVWGDRGRIAQLLANLIGNALKYRSPEVPSIVRVSSKPTECGATLIAVTDNGIGIDARHHAAIFQIFKRLHAREEFEGTGAGLAICLKIVQAHAGRIWVESAVGQGSTFFVELPNGPEPVKTTSREAASETSIARGHPHSTSHTPP